MTIFSDCIQQQQQLEVVGSTHAKKNKTMRTPEFYYSTNVAAKWLKDGIGFKFTILQCGICDNGDDRKYLEKTYSNICFQREIPAVVIFQPLSLSYSFIPVPGKRRCHAWSTRVPTGSWAHHGAEGDGG